MVLLAGSSRSMMMGTTGWGSRSWCPCWRATACWRRSCSSAEVHLTNAAMQSQCFNYALQCIIVLVQLIYWTVTKMGQETTRNLFVERIWPDVNRNEQWMKLNINPFPSIDWIHSFWCLPSSTLCALMGKWPLVKCNVGLVMMTNCFPIP